MEKLSNVGRIFFSTAIAGLGIQTIYYHDFPYMLIPPNHLSISILSMLTYISGSMLILAGACIVFKIQTRTISLLLGSVLLLIFCFYYVPYEFTVSSNFMHLGEWENALKELALSSGAFVVAGSISGKSENSFIRVLTKFIPFGAIVFSMTMICFGIGHFLYAKDASEYIPSWISNRMFWTYLAGIALIGSGIAIILKIKPGLIACLLGGMIFIWFIILHIPKVMESPLADRGGEITSALLALAYSGIAFIIAGRLKDNN